MQALLLSQMDHSGGVGNSGGSSACVAARGLRGISLHSNQFCGELTSKTTKKKKSLKSSKKGGEGLDASYLGAPREA